MPTIYIDEQVKSISMLKEFIDYVPTNCVDAQFSLPYMAASALLDRPVGPQWLSEASLNDPEVLGMAGKVAFDSDPEAERIFYEMRWAEYPCTVTVLARGKEYKASMRIPRSLTEAEIEQKFRQLSKPVLGNLATEKIIKSVRQLQDLTQVASLAKIFTNKSKE